MLLKILPFWILFISHCKPAAPVHDSNGLSLDDAFASLDDKLDFERCKRKKLLYDRAAGPAGGRCTDISTATNYPCDAHGVSQAFEAIGYRFNVVKGVGKKSDYLAEFPGYKIDQCGEIKGDPVVILLRIVSKENADGDHNDESAATIEIKSLCKKGSNSCLYSNIN